MNDLPNDMNIIIATYLKPLSIEQKYENGIKLMKNKMRQNIFKICDKGYFTCEEYENKMKLIFLNPDNLHISDVDDLYNILRDLWWDLDCFEIDDCFDYDYRVIRKFLNEYNFECICELDDKEKLYNSFFNLEIFLKDV
jgi:hypothetical protein